jgi:branched-subunit amino acid aminotransferase/4-amino-4-deoxychorismate lyase
MTLLALAVAAAASSIRPSRCSAPTTRRSSAAGGVRDDPRLRRPAVQLAEHLDRLAGSAERIGLPAVNRLELEALAQQALDAAGAPTPCSASYWTPTPVALALVSALADHYDELRARGRG